MSSVIQLSSLLKSRIHLQVLFATLPVLTALLPATSPFTERAWDYTSKVFIDAPRDHGRNAYASAYVACPPGGIS